MGTQATGYFSMFGSCCLYAEGNKIDSGMGGREAGSGKPGRLMGQTGKVLRDVKQESFRGS
jgi:hypothetical protein